MAPASVRDILLCVGSANAPMKRISDKNFQFFGGMVMWANNVSPGDLKPIKAD